MGGGRTSSGSGRCLALTAGIVGGGSLRGFGGSAGSMTCVWTGWAGCLTEVLLSLGGSTGLWGGSIWRTTCAGWVALLLDRGGGRARELVLAFRLAICCCCA
jgi:hypothetical protein